jgi:hypothetical protein
LGDQKSRVLIGKHILLAFVIASVVQLSDVSIGFAEDARTIEDETTETIDERIEDSTIRAKKVCNCIDDYSVSYRERRQDWGFTFQVGFSQYEPLDYRPDFAAGQNFENYYGSSQLPLIDAAFAVKYNMDFASIALEGGAGNYSNSQGLNGTSLSVTPARVGLILYLDTLFEEPYVVPYAGGGAAMAWYSETVASQKVGGNTGLGAYYVFGLGIQIDWLDPNADRTGQQEGLENTFAYIEGRGFSMNGGRVAELSNSLSLGAGLRIEL